MIVALAGRAAEEVVFGRVTNGAANDLEKVTDIARSMVFEWGMADSVSSRTLRADNYALSEETKRLRDSEQARLTDSAYAEALRLLQKHRALARPARGGAAREGDARPRRGGRAARRRRAPSRAPPTSVGVPRVVAATLATGVSAASTPPVDALRPAVASIAWKHGESTTSGSRSRSRRGGARRTSASSAAGSSIANASRIRASRRRRSASATAGSSCSRRSATTRRSASSSRSAGPGMHHVAYEVDDVRAALADLAARRRRADRRASRGSGMFGLEVAFVHPDSVHGVLSEVVSGG